LINSASGSIQVSLNGKIVLRTDNSIISLNTLYLVTLTKNGNVMRIFRNGDAVGTITNSPLINISNNMMYLGYNFIGILDQVSIYPSPLSKVEIQNQVNQLSLRILFLFCLFFFCFVLFILFLFLFYFFIYVSHLILSFHFFSFHFIYLFFFFKKKKHLLATKACGGCLNGGICGENEGGKQCFCSQCLSGNLCEIKMNGCENPCKNGGINVDGICQCAFGFKGPTCSSGIFFLFFFPFFFFSFFLFSFFFFFLFFKD